MEFDRELYQRTFSRLKASPEKIQEVIHMTENRKIKKTARRALAAVAVTALAALTAMGANAATGGQLFARMVSFTQSADGRTAEMVFEVDNGAQGGGGEMSFHIYESGEEGKAVVNYQDEKGRPLQAELDMDVDAELSLDGRQLQVNGVILEGDRAVVQYAGEDGEAAVAVLMLPEDCQGFESLNDLLQAKGKVSGATQDGGAYELTAGK